MHVTQLAINGKDFWINGQPTYRGRTWNGCRIEGLLLNSRMVQATFDDLNPDTRGNWAYPDTGVWDPDRNTDELIAMLPEYRRHGLLAISLNLQGGSPRSYSRIQPWINTAFTADGDLRPAYLARLKRILDRLAELGMVAIVGLFYFGQDERLYDDAAVQRGVDNAVRWLLEGGWENVIVEINNECDVPLYDHPILQPPRVHELIEAAKEITHGGRRLLVGTSYALIEQSRARSPWVQRALAGVTDEEIDRLRATTLSVSDVALIHGNGIHLSAEVGPVVERIRMLCANRPIPIVFNEDDHYAFDQPTNNFVEAVRHRASWGYFDAGPGAGGVGARSDYVEGFQNVPVNWGINTDRKRGFFNLLKNITGG
jgi:hypothetical protein